MAKEGKKAEHTHHKKGAEQFKTETVRALYKEHMKSVSADSMEGEQDKKTHVSHH